MYIQERLLSLVKRSQRPSSSARKLFMPELSAGEKMILLLALRFTVSPFPNSASSGAVTSAKAWNDPKSLKEAANQFPCHSAARVMVLLSLVLLITSLFFHS